MKNQTKIKKYEQNDERHSYTTHLDWFGFLPYSLLGSEDKAWRTLVFIARPV